MASGRFAALAKSITVGSMEEFEAAQEDLEPGDSLIWRAGTFENMPLELLCDSITFTSVFGGATVFSGSSSLKVTGNHNIVSGFQFVGGKIEGDLIDVYGNYNRIDNINMHSYDSHYYLRVRPNCVHNIISNCNFEAKPESQETSVVQIEATEDLPGYHLITHCSFKNHTAPPGAGEDFGIEALRIGYSYQRHMISRATVEYCYFEKCNGDYEVISCKACENVMRFNTFINNGPAHLTLRHGSRNVIYGNFFINGAGVRIKEGQNHAVVNNYFDTGDEFAIHLQNHHFDPVDTVTISNNTFIKYSTFKLGSKGDHPPENILLSNNLFSATIDTIFTDETGRETWIQNVVQSDEEGSGNAGFISASFDFKTNTYELEEPGTEWKFEEEFSPYIPKIFDIPVLDDDFKINQDIMKQSRNSNLHKIPGCYLPTGKVPLAFYAMRNNTGPMYLREK